MKLVDLRSDTVTLPSPAMRDAILHAELGDDWYREDPTINRLQRLAADMLGMEDALFVASGSMANLVAVLTHCESDDRVLAGSESHIHYYESEGLHRIADVDMRTLPNDAEGRIDPEELESVLWESEGPPVDLVCLENTHMRCGGVPLTSAYTEKIAAVAHGRGVPLHIDGARIFNAAVALGTPVASLAEGADSVMFCLSKGLACPAGSVLCGSGEFIALARQSRKWVGGAMRQVGVLGAAGIVALESMVDRLADDHANARLLAEGLAAIADIGIEAERVSTNIVIFTVRGREVRDFLAVLADDGILALPVGPDRVRMVAHYGIERDDIERTLVSVREAMSKLPVGGETAGPQGQST